MLLTIFLDSNPRRKQIFSEEIVESKRHDRSMTAVINGLTIGQAQEKGLVSEPSSREVSMGEDEQDEYSAEEASSEEEDVQHKVQPKVRPASPTKAAFQTPTTPTISASGNPFNQPTTTTPTSTISAIRNPFDTAVQPAKSTATTLQQPLFAPKTVETPLESGKGQETTDEETSNPFLLSSNIMPQNNLNPFGLTTPTSVTSKPFEISSVNPANSNLLPFSAAMKQFQEPTPAPGFDFGAVLRQATAQQTAATSNQPSQTARSGIPAIDTSHLPPNKNFDFGFKKSTQPVTPWPDQTSNQPSSVSNEPLTPAATPGNALPNESATLGAAKASFVASVTPASTPSHYKTPPTTTFQAGLSQGQGLFTFDTPPSKLLFQPAVQGGQAATPSNPSAIPGLFHSTSVATPPTLISSVDPLKEAREQLIDQLAHELMDGGANSYLDQFFEHVLGGIVKESLEMVQKEEDDMLVGKFAISYVHRTICNGGNVPRSINMLFKIAPLLTTFV